MSGFDCLINFGSNLKGCFKSEGVFGSGYRAGRSGSGGWREDR